MIVKAACIQTNSGPDIEDNLKTIEPVIRAAAKDGAQFIALPENVCAVVRGREKIAALARSEKDHPGIPFFSRLAKETGAWILCGSATIAPDIASNGEKFANRSYLFNAQGEIAAFYDKIHMFDANVGAGEKYRESENFRNGDRAVVAESPWGKIGLTICYDVRFAYLYRALAQAGAGIITVPSAFTVPTGKMHWEVLLRARAIETGAFILAPAQCGEHDGGRHTYGHSLIVDPLGKILAEAGEKPETIMVDLDLTKVDEARRMLPSLKNDCAFDAP
jgi:predicted amidohydrolase